MFCLIAHNTNIDKVVRCLLISKASVRIKAGLKSAFQSSQVSYLQVARVLLLL